MLKVIMVIVLTATSIITSVVYHVTQKADIEYYQGHRYFEKGDYSKALPFYQKSLAINPSHISSLRDLGRTYQWTGKHDQAVGIFRKILSIKPKENAAKKALAETLSWQKKYPEAIELFRQVIDATGDADAMLELAEIYQWDGQFEKSKEVLNIMPLSRSKEARARLLYAKAFLYTGDTDKAASILEGLLLENAIRKDQKLIAETEKLLAEATMMRKDYDKAIERYKKEVRDNPQDMKARIMLADMLSWVKRYDESIGEYNKALEIEPGNIEVKAKLARIYSWVKDYGKAETLLKEVLAADPKDAESRILLADMLSWHKKYAESIAEYEKILSADPSNDEIRFALAQVCSWDKKYSQAERLYREIIAEDPGNMPARIALGELLLWQRKHREAADHLKELLAERDDPRTRLMYGKALLYSADYKSSREIFNDILAKEPDNVDAKIFLADSYAYNKEFKRAVELYNEALKQRPDREAKRKLADVLSWDKKYDQAVKLYDELLAEEVDGKIRLQKARVLGWARHYPEALTEYRLLVQETGDPLIRLEMEAKRAYWDDRVKSAISRYDELIKKSPENVEAMFDLAQICSYQSMWKKAVGEYRRILALAPNHFRAKDGLEKALMISEHVSWETGYDYIEADSQSRDMDIRKYTIFNKFTGYVRPDIVMEGRYNFTARSFSDFSNVIENEERIKVTYLGNPAGWASGFYDLIAYNKDIDPMNTFGGEFGFRIFDAGTVKLSYERQRLQNSSSVIRWHDYEDDFTGRADISVSKRLKIGADYTYAHYSDRNFRNEPGFDLLYFFSLDPLRFSVKYRYFYKAFDDVTPDYWSPKGFMTNALFFNWRHFLNKEEVFFGADDLYYDLGYNVSVDSGTVVGHTFSGQLHWDVNKRFSLDVKGYFTRSSNKVYKEDGLTGTIKYYF